jgi:hypothetical protein
MDLVDFLAGSLTYSASERSGKKKKKKKKLSQHNEPSGQDRRDGRSAH